VEQQFDLQWLPLEADSPLVDRTIREAAIRKETGASIVGVIRQESLTANPEPDFRFAANDLVAIIGTDAARTAFRLIATRPGRAGGPIPPGPAAP
jgi:CPA2 family monovalent cation:H+ antiporter-2